MLGCDVMVSFCDGIEPSRVRGRRIPQLSQPETSWGFDLLPCGRREGAHGDTEAPNTSRSPIRARHPSNPEVNKKDIRQGGGGRERWWVSFKQKQKHPKQKGGRRRRQKSPKFLGQIQANCPYSGQFWPSRSFANIRET